MTKPTNKVLLCPVEIANQLHIIDQELKKNDIKCDTLIFNKNKYYPDNKYTHSLNLHKHNLFLRPFVKIHHLVKLVDEYEVFHFFSKSFTYSHIDLIWLKHKNKKIIYHYHGSDIRPPWYITKTFSVPFKELLIAVYNSIFNKIVFAFVDKIIVSTPDLLRYIPVNATYIPNSVYPLKQKFIRKNKIPTIVHAPTNNNKKGTVIIEKTIDRLKKDYKFVYKRISSSSNKETIERIVKSDYIIDQILIGWYGVLAIESMMLKKPVIVYVNNRYSNETIPIINVNEKTLYAQLSKLLSKKIKIDRKKIYKYAINNHHPQINIKKIIKLYK